MTEDTGRLRSALRPEIQRILYTASNPRPTWKDELAYITEIDLAHVLMLGEQRIIPQETAITLLREIHDLRADDFDGLAGRPKPRGLYLTYEKWLIERVGLGIGGVLHTGRSRNDLNATVLALEMRGPVRRLSEEIVALGAALMERSCEYRQIVMPAYTHYQAAVPVTLGHYLAGVAAALSRDAAWLFHSAEGLRRCPLGAGAVGGTTIPIQAERTAELLGFTEPVLNSVDAVASRDVLLRVTASAALVGVLLDRVAQDLLLWATDEFGFVVFPEDMVGSSSMMPQKRNPFILEHVQGKSAAAFGALVGAVGAMRGRPFTNSIAVGTEAVGLSRAGLEPTVEAVRILRFAIEGIRPNSMAMARRAYAGQTIATALAERLVNAGMPFRQAHFEVGAAARDVARGRCEDLEAAVAMRVAASGANFVEPADVVNAADHGGGPGPHAFDKAMQRLDVEWREHRATFDTLVEPWEKAQRCLAREIDELLEGAHEQP